MSIVQYCIHSQFLLVFMYTYTCLPRHSQGATFCKWFEGGRGILQVPVTSLLLLLMLVPDLHSSQDVGNTLQSPSKLGSLSMLSGLASNFPSLPLAVPHDWQHCHIKGCSSCPRPYLISMVAMHSCYFTLLHPKPCVSAIIQLLLSMNLCVLHTGCHSPDYSCISTLCVHVCWNK